MPATSVVFYQEQTGKSPVVDWLRELNETNPKAFDKCRAAVARLGCLGTSYAGPRLITYATGFTLRTANSARVPWKSKQAVVDGRTVSVVAHGLTKEAVVPASDINQALTRKAAFAANPTAHTFTGEFDDA